jgi:hypothetical protein
MLRLLILMWFMFWLGQSLFGLTDYFMKVDNSDFDNKVYVISYFITVLNLHVINFKKLNF